MKVSMLVIEFLMACRAGRDGALPLTRDTVRSYEVHLKRCANFFGESLVRDISVARARQYQMHLLECCNSRTTAQRAFTIAKTMFKYAVAHGYIDQHPMESLTIRLRSAQHDLSKRIKIFSTDELKHLLITVEQLRNTENSAQHKKWTQFYPFVLCLSFLGLRSSEAFGLQFDDFSTNFETVEIRRRVETPKKGMKSIDDRIGFTKSKNSVRRIPIPATLSREFFRLSESRENGQSFVFISNRGTPLNYTNVLQRMWYPALQEAGLPRYGMHSLRHHYASLLMKKGRYNDLSKLLGHSTANFTMDRYGHLMEDDKEYMQELADIVSEDMITADPLVSDFRKKKKSKG